MERGDGVANVRVKKIESGGGAVTPIACDVGRISWQFVDASFPNQTEYQVGLGDEDIVWVDERVPDGAVAPTITIRSAPR
jgi:hypothetical protein